MNILVNLFYVYLLFGGLLAAKLLYELWSEYYNQELLLAIEFYIGIHNEIALKLFLSFLIIISIIILPILFMFDNIQ